MQMCFWLVFYKQPDAYALRPGNLTFNDFNNFYSRLSTLHVTIWGLNSKSYYYQGAEKFVDQKHYLGFALPIAVIYGE